MQRCAPALLRRWKRDAALCRDAQDFLKASLGDYSAILTCAGMLKADLNMNERALCFTMAMTTRCLLHLQATRWPHMGIAVLVRLSSSAAALLCPCGAEKAQRRPW